MDCGKNTRPYFLYPLVRQLNQPASQDPDAIQDTRLDCFVAPCMYMHPNRTMYTVSVTPKTVGEKCSHEAPEYICARSRARRARKPKEMKINAT